MAESRKAGMGLSCSLLSSRAEGGESILTMLVD